jgi:1-deoxy-D-xylulose-5-phosphate reductoisomerase
MRQRRHPLRIALLGATGSIGSQVCDVVSRHPDRFVLHSLIAGRDRYRLQALAGLHPQAHLLLAAESDRDQMLAAVVDPEVDLVVVAGGGSSSLGPTLAAIEAGKDIALATKEVLVMAGELVRAAMRKSGSQLFPIDSEHSAIWQCLWGEHSENVRRLILTGSGGPFLRRPLNTLESVTVEEALAHPRWKMGPKITVDSATMMNKGLEIIEAHYLFDIPVRAIDVVVHPQSLVHSLVEFVDGSLKAQLGPADMHLPIAVAMAYPDRLPDTVEAPSLAQVGSLTFEPVDPDRFPSLGVARKAAERGGSAPAVLNAANEQAVSLFLEGRLPFDRIVLLVEGALEDAEDDRGALQLDALLQADARARQFVLSQSMKKVSGTHSKVEP